MRQYLVVGVLTLAALTVAMGMRNGIVTPTSSNSGQSVLVAWGGAPVPPGNGIAWGGAPVPPDRGSGLRWGGAPVPPDPTPTKN